MASMHSSASATLFLLLNLVFLTLISSCPTCVKPKSSAPSGSSSSGSGPTSSCPRDVLKFGVCGKLLSGSIGAVVGNPPDHPCCSLIKGLMDLKVAVCLCTALKANILGININLPIDLSLLVNTCGKKLPSNYQSA